MRKSIYLYATVALVMSGCQRSSPLKDYNKSRFQAESNQVLGSMVARVNSIAKSSRSASRGLHSGQTGSTTFLPSSPREHASQCISESNAIQQSASNYAFAMLTLALCLNQDLNRNPVFPYAYSNFDEQGRSYYRYLNSMGAGSYSEFSQQPHDSDLMWAFISSGGWPH